MYFSLLLGTIQILNKHADDRWCLTNSDTDSVDDDSDGDDEYDDDIADANDRGGNAIRNGNIVASGNWKCCRILVVVCWFSHNNVMKRI